MVGARNQVKGGDLFDVMQREPTISFVNVSKDFGLSRVLNDVSLDFYPGSIHALLGANGSGKSTLIKILAGYHSPTSGQVRVNGQDMAAQSNWTAAAKGFGVRFIHQDLGLVGTLSVADNFGVASGFATQALGINWSRHQRRVSDSLESVGLQRIDPSVLIKKLGPVEQSLVAIARATADIGDSGGCVVLDEPTARLPDDQVAELSERCRGMRDRGISLIYISHRLDEVFSLCDTVSVLRDGELVLAGAPTDSTSVPELTELITGASAPSGAAKSEGLSMRVRAADPILETLSLSGDRVRDLNVQLYPGEILAVTGLAGSGRSELGRLLFGSQKVREGSVRFKGRDITGALTPGESMARGIAYIPQDRKQALIPRFNVTENAILPTIKNFVKRFSLSTKLTTRFTGQLIEEFGVQPARPSLRIMEFSGGNQQKIVLGKWLALQPDVLILDESTYGVDVGARESIMSIVKSRVAEKGLSVMLLDSDIDLVAAHSDRVIVMQNGRVVSEMVGSEINPASVAEASYAVAKSN